MYRRVRELWETTWNNSNLADFHSVESTQRRSRKLSSNSFRSYNDEFSEKENIRNVFQKILICRYFNFIFNKKISFIGVSLVPQKEFVFNNCDCFWVFTDLLETFTETIQLREVQSRVIGSKISARTFKTCGQKLISKYLKKYIIIKFLPYTRKIQN